MSVPILYAGSRYQPGVMVPIPTPPPPPVPPQFSSAEIGTIDAMTLVVTFDQAIIAAENDYALGVTVKVNGATTGLVAGFRQANHAVVNYVVPVLWHGSADVVTWEYNSATGIIVAESDATPLGNVTAQSVTNNCEYTGRRDYQADTLVLSDNDPISTWPDLSGNGQNFTQTGSARPTYKASGGSPVNFGAYPSTFFDGVDDFMDGGTGTDLNNLAAWTIMQINGYNNEIIAKIANKSSAAGWVIDSAGLQTFLQEAGGSKWTQFDVTDPPFIEPRIVTNEIVSRDLSRIYIQGVSQDLTDNSVHPIFDYSSSDHILIGKATSYAVQTGQFAAVMIFAPPPNATNRAALEARLAARYGITL